MSPAHTISGDRIKLARHRQGMTQQALAVAAGVSERNIVRWENDKNTPRADHLSALAHATGCDIEFFYEAGGDTDDEEEAALPDAMAALEQALMRVVRRAVRDEARV